MRKAVACLAIAVVPAFAADAPAPSVMKEPLAACAECAVVRSVRSITREIRGDASADARPSGFVATFPLDGGKREAGSSSRIGKDAVPVSERWEVVVRYDDGRFRVLNLGEAPEIRAGDKVRIDANGNLVLRTD